uniref:Uncharacterized protein n=1 Tax=Globodera rostochiensis TaxID=31243 RepID=A0A914IG07_GLORO
MNGLTFGALLNVVTEDATDQIVLNLKQFTPLSSILVKTLESLMGTIPERRNSINYQIIPATYIPLVTMVYNKRLDVKQILQEIEKNLEYYHDMTITLVFANFLNAVDKHHFKQAMPKQIKFGEEKKSEFLLQSIYLFVKKITQKCLQLFDTDQNENLWDTSSKNFISHVKPVSESKLRVVYSQFCIAQSEGFKPVFGEWRTNWAENQPMIGFDHFLYEKIRIEIPTEIARETITDVKNVPIVLITRRHRGFSFRKKKKFFNVIIDGTEIVYTDAGIYMTKVDYFWPKEKYKKHIIFCADDIKKLAAYTPNYNKIVRSTRLTCVTGKSNHVLNLFI